ncbi:hypothetical protein [Scleromatobacter humisilvae]|uniref:Uncharacterized protein n=1 Tax=Scleromatobacter humisilvae TaxID=2897159 RepID=A0A9X1YQQ1_9BURK|nr:hypothetical protein [Scleromatobacter humisilvae]MCK9689518.1 hypothetical protein [Scleromatobacter humisilvae]
MLSELESAGASSVATSLAAGGDEPVASAQAQLAGVRNQSLEPAQRALEGFRIAASTAAPSAHAQARAVDDAGTNARTAMQRGDLSPAQSHQVQQALEQLGNALVDGKLSPSLDASLRDNLYDLATADAGGPRFDGALAQMTRAAQGLEPGAATHSAPLPPPRTSSVARDDSGKALPPLCSTFDFGHGDAKTTSAQYLLALQARTASTGAIAPQDLAKSKTILFQDYGYPMAGTRLASDQLSALSASARVGSPGTADYAARVAHRDAVREHAKASLRGNLDDTNVTPDYLASMKDFAGSTPERRAARFDFYSKIEVTSRAGARAVDVTRGDRTIKVSFAPDVSGWANAAGVPTADALRKTDFAVYEKAIDAAFATPGMTGFTINGAWRPAPSDVTAMGMTPSSHNEGSLHITSWAVDINAITYADAQGQKWTYDINNAPEDGTAAYQRVPDSHPSRYETTTDRDNAVYQAFYDNFYAQKGTERELFDPWQMWADHGTYAGHPDNSPTVLSISNNDFLHHNHLHLAIKPPPSH